MKVALLNVATGKYASLVPALWKSAEEHFLPGHEVHFFLFTDSTAFEATDSRHIVPQKHIHWPGATLFRYNFFEPVLARLEAEGFDFVFYCDVDMRFVAPVGDEILSDLVGALHPGYWDKPPSVYPYETNPASTACVAPEKRGTYYYGAINGGSVAGFGALIRELAAATLADHKKGLIAVWHDESHLNRYMADNPPTKTLDPGYCYPESLDLPFTKRLLALDKDHKAMRG